MPVTALVTTAGLATANAYVALTVADQYHLDRPAVGTTWATASVDSKTAAILWATKLMDRMWHWVGYPTDNIQALLWPRTGVIKANGWEYVDYHTIPTELQEATAEYARQLLVADRAGDNQIETLGLRQLTAGPVSMSFKESVVAKVVPDAVFNLIPNGWGYPTSRATSTRDLVRS